MKNSKELYAEMPSVLQAHYIKRGKPLGQTGEEFFVAKQSERNEDIMSMYQSQSEEQLQDHLADVSITLANMCEYLNLIDSPFAKEADELQGAMMRFQANFSTKKDCDNWNETYGKENPSEPKAEPVSFHTTIQHNGS